MFAGCQPQDEILGKTPMQLNVAICRISSLTMRTIRDVTYWAAQCDDQSAVLFNERVQQSDSVIYIPRHIAGDTENVYGEIKEIDAGLVKPVEESQR